MAVALNHDDKSKSPLRQVDMCSDLNPVTGFEILGWPETKAFLARLGVPMNRQTHLTIIIGEQDEVVRVYQEYQGVDYRSREGVRT